jgi:hypothetical protein
MVKLRLAVLIVAGLAIYPSIPVLAQTANPYNYAAQWSAWSETSRQAFLIGYAAGAANAYFAAARGWLPSGEVLRTHATARVRSVRLAVQLGDGGDQIPAIITNLYQDPANAFIAVNDMVLIARDQLKGEDVAVKLQEARRIALESYRLQRNRAK